jgi:hypothetical protein
MKAEKIFGQIDIWFMDAGFKIKTSATSAKNKLFKKNSVNINYSGKNLIFINLISLFKHILLFLKALTIAVFLFILTPPVDARPVSYQDQYTRANTKVVEAMASIHSDSARVRQIKSDIRGGPMDVAQQAELDQLTSRIRTNTRLAHEGHQQRQEAERIASFLVSQN